MLYKMAIIFRSKSNILTPSKNGLVKGSGIVLNRRGYSVKEPIVSEDKDSKTFEDGKKVLKSNRISLPNKKENQKAVLHLPMQNKAQAFEAKDVIHKIVEGGSLVNNKLKIPITLMKKKESKNNIKLVF